MGKLNVLTRDEFEDIINELDESERMGRDINGIVNDRYRQAGCEPLHEFVDAVGFTTVHHEAIVNLLRRMFLDEDDFIGYFIYEIDYGRSELANSVKDADGNPIPLSTPGDLYDLLVRSMNWNRCVSEDDGKQ